MPELFYLVNKFSPAILRSTRSLPSFVDTTRWRSAAVKKLSLIHANGLQIRQKLYWPVARVLEQKNIVLNASEITAILREEP